MVKEVTIEPGTFVTADNWDELKAKGLVHETNVKPYEPDEYGDPREPTRTLEILQWDVGENRVFAGWAFIDGRPQSPRKFIPRWGFGDDTGFYVVPPADDWTDFCDRTVWPDHPE